MGMLIDVSMEIFSGMLVWPGDEEVDLRRVEEMEEGAPANLSRIRCGVHTGTHVDAPLHFIPGGKSVEQLPLAVLNGPAWVAGFPAAERIRAEELERAGIPEGTERLLMKTRNSDILGTLTSFREEYAGLDESGARWILEKKIRLVGIDFLSVSCPGQTVPVHELLLGAEVILVEGLLLGSVPAGACRFHCLPVKLKGADGAPARAVVEVAG
jgi:arylformamidase